jgi:hypothetical protein
MRNIYILIFLFVGLLSCNQIKEKTKETINDGGEIVGKSATEFIEGVSEGIDETIKRDIVLTENTKPFNFETGKSIIENDDFGNANNVLVQYFIFNQSIDTVLTAKVLDKEGVELGRTKAKVEYESGDADYVEFIFDDRTYIDVKSKIEISIK